MTVREFRESPELVARMRQIFEDDVFKLWLETFEQGENPMNKIAPPSITPHGAYIMLGEQTGWRQCLTGFVLGAVPIETPKPKGTAADQTYTEEEPPPETE